MSQPVLATSPPEDMTPLREQEPAFRGAGFRLCPQCGANDALADKGVVWPPGWQCAACGHTVASSDGIPLYAPALANSEHGFDPAAFDRLAQSEEGHFWFEPRNRLLAGLAQKYFPGAKRYLEIGCGTGMVLAAIAKSRSWQRLAGSELHSAGLIHAQRRLGGRAELVQMDARTIPARAAFDLVGAFDVIEHIAEDDVVLREVHAALVPGGGFVVAVPQHPSLWSPADDLGHHVRRYRRGELEAKLQSAGFEILFSTSYTSVLLPLMIANRLLSRLRPETGEARVRGELTVHPALNAGLRRMLDMEVALSLKGLSWPIGGSRIVVARKYGS